MTDPINQEPKLSVETIAMIDRYMEMPITGVLLCGAGASENLVIVTQDGEPIGAIRRFSLDVYVGGEAYCGLEFADGRIRDVPVSAIETRNLEVAIADGTLKFTAAEL